MNEINESYQENFRCRNLISWNEFFRDCEERENIVGKWSSMLNFIYKLCSSRNRGSEYRIIHTSPLDRTRPVEGYAIERDSKSLSALFRQPWFSLFSHFAFQFSFWSIFNLHTKKNSASFKWFIFFWGLNSEFLVNYFFFSRLGYNVWQKINQVKVKNMNSVTKKIKAKLRSREKKAKNSCPTR